MKQQERHRGVFDVPVLVVVALGGALGSLARYALTLLLPVAGDGTFPWSTFLTNISGCLLIGMLMVFVLEVGGHRLLRPFLGIGVLGGFTTMSTYAVDVLTLSAGSQYATALLYLAATLTCAVPAVLVGMWAVRALRR